MPATLDTAWEYAESLLLLCNDLLAETEDATVTHNPGGAIDRAYVWFGKPAIECEQLTVSWWGFSEQGQVNLGAALPRKDARTNLIAFLVTVARDCVPIAAADGESPPEIERSEESARELARDVYALWTGIYRAWRNDELFGGKCSRLLMTRGGPLEPQGDISAFEIELVAEIDGLDVASGS